MNAETFIKSLNKSVDAEDTSQITLEKLKNWKSNADANYGQIQKTLAGVGINSHYLLFVASCTPYLWEMVLSMEDRRVLSQIAGRAGMTLTDLTKPKPSKNSNMMANLTAEAQLQVLGGTW